jgi:hypothetical protein
MTESDDDKIDKLAKAYAKLERIQRFQILAITLAAGGAGLINMVESTLFDGRLALPNALRWGAMTMIALTGCFLAMMLYRIWKKQNAEIVELYRHLQAAGEALEGWKPLAEFVADAHSRGATAVIPPPFPGEDRAPKPPVLH